MIDHAEARFSIYSDYCSLEPDSDVLVVYPEYAHHPKLRVWYHPAYFGS